MVTSDASRGRSSRLTALPPHGVSSGRVISTRLAWPLRKLISRTRSPTETASSTNAASIRGVDTATSTPQFSSNSHSLRGSFTLATTRGTANSVLASRLTTTLALSSPVAAITTSKSWIPTDSSRVNSHASPRRQCAAGMSSTSMCAGLRSSSVTSWESTSSRAMDRPTAPAPAMATFTRSSLIVHVVARRQRGDRHGLGDVTRHGGQVHLVAGLNNGLGLGQQPAAEADHERHPSARGALQGGHAVAHPVLVQRQLGHADIARRVAPLGGLGLPGEDVEQPIRGPWHRRHRRNAEPLVNRRALGVVDPGDHALHAEGLTRHA